MTEVTYAGVRITIECSKGCGEAIGLFVDTADVGVAQRSLGDRRVEEMLSRIVGIAGWHVQKQHGGGLRNIHTCPACRYARESRGHDDDQEEEQDADGREEDQQADHH